MNCDSAMQAKISKLRKHKSDEDVDLADRGILMRQRS